MTLAKDGRMTKAGPVVTVAKGSGPLIGLSWITCPTIAYDESLSTQTA